jgi:hypothetical protein
MQNSIKWRYYVVYNSFIGQFPEILYKGPGPTILTNEQESMLSYWFILTNKNNGFCLWSVSKMVHGHHPEATRNSKSFQENPVHHESLYPFDDTEVINK